MADATGLTDSSGTAAAAALELDALLVPLRQGGRAQPLGRPRTRARYRKLLEREGDQDYMLRAELMRRGESGDADLRHGSA